MRHTLLLFSPTGGVRRAAECLMKALCGEFETLDLSLTLNGQKKTVFAPEDICVIAVPSYGGRVPAVALKRLLETQGGGAKTVLMSVYGNRSDDDTLFELRDEAVTAGYRPVAAVRAIAEHSLVRSVAAGRPDEADQKKLCAFAQTLKAYLAGDDLSPVDLPEKKNFRLFGGVPFHPKAGDACMGCGKCADVCPVGAISREDPRKTDTGACITCMRCVEICPQRARSVNPMMLAVVAGKLKKSCADRKEPELILGRA